MLYTKIQSQSFFGSGEKKIKCFLPYIGILFSGAEPFEQIDITPSIEGPI